MDQKIHIYVRHCDVSPSSVNKSRPYWFNKENIFQNLLNTTEKDKNIDITVILDSDPSTHFTNKYLDRCTIFPAKGGTDAHSFHNQYDKICEDAIIKKYDENDIIYLLEDDYLHKYGWTDVMRDGFKSIPNVKYITLYDHPDKYDLNMYPTITSTIFTSKFSHWRNIPSTTNTYALKVGTLLQFRKQHTEYSDRVTGNSYDHKKFTYLTGTLKHLLVSPLPAYATHVETGQLSPIVKWYEII